MKMHIIRAITVSFAAMAFASCRNTDKVSTPDRTADTASVKVERKALTADPLYDRIGKLLAGNREGADTSSNQIKKDSSGKPVDRFARIEQERLQPMLVWNKEVLNSNGVQGSRLLFYPFSGGDLIHAHALFPDAGEYMMVAREPVGDIPDLFRQDSAFRESYLKDIDIVLRDIYQKSFFITLNMEGDLGRKTKISGIAPILLWSLSKLGYEIASVRYFEIDSAGMKSPLETKGDMREGLVEIGFFRNGDSLLRTVSYLSCDLSDKGIAANPRYLKFIGSKLPGSVNTFVKSASYLMHGSNFTRIRDMVVERSGYLVQDDTGVPFRYLPADRFRFRLFGGYQTPIPPFGKTYFQKDLDAAYRDSSMYAGPLGFSLGYHWWGGRKQNQLVAVRK